jgi:2-oxoisovalerate dehydrogenase E1 component
MAKGEQNSKSTSSMSAKDMLEDFRIANLSRQVSLLGRKEVLTGKAKFGIFGDGKELGQIAWAKAFKHGDWRAGYYRDQTFMFAIGALTVKQYFAQLYADPDLEREPASGGRQMNCHFASRYVESDGSWKPQTSMYNISADASPTAAQMPRLLGLSYASKIYRGVPELASHIDHSHKGDEVCFGTIGDASTSEGIFWETLNAAGVLQVPMVMSVWDDGYGISVPKKYQTTRESISELLRGFNPGDGKTGLSIHYVKGWDYPALVEMYQSVVAHVRKTHAPALIHVDECTQPQGHSTSGSHERYKTPERLAFEGEIDCLVKFKQWLLQNNVANETELAKIEKDATEQARTEQEAAWRDYVGAAEGQRSALSAILNDLQDVDGVSGIHSSLMAVPTIRRRDVHVAARRAIYATRTVERDRRSGLIDFEKNCSTDNFKTFGSHLYAEGDRSPLRIGSVEPKYPSERIQVQASQILQKNFEALFAKDSRVFSIGEDVGKLGDVNRGMDGIQARFGELRCTDTGIREATILGQGYGAAMRGLRPIVDIQYLDYMLYCFQTLSDDVATLHYRTAGGQIAPVIVRTRGHRLEGIWHTGSPMGVLVHGCRGVHVCVPRNMTQAAGMYNTLIQGDDPAVVIEVLNGYRLREDEPTNFGEFTVPLGVPEVLSVGNDVTIVTYGASVRVAEEALLTLQQFGISAELIDVQTLLPFDRHGIVASSIAKTHAVLFFDEDVPGGAAAYMMQQVLERDRAHEELDAEPRTLTASAYRSAYGSDADYYSKPSAEDVVESVYAIMHERNPYGFPSLKD